MPRARAIGLGALAALAALAAAGESAAPAGEGGESIAVIVHPAVDVGALDTARLETIFGGTQRSWPDGKPIIAFNLPPDDPARVELERVVLHMTPEQVSRYWIDQRIRSGQRPPRQISDPMLAVRLVAKLPGSIGYVPARLADANVRVVARIRAGKVVPP
jgi:ABC-type phosphate transport system substrate-binding protein